MKLNKTESRLMSRIAYCRMAEKVLAECFGHREVLAAISLERKGLVRYQNNSTKIDGVNYSAAIIYPTN